MATNPVASTIPRHSAISAFPPEEPLGVVDVVGGQTPIRAAPGPPPLHRRRAGQVRLLGEDRPLQPDQLRARAPTPTRRPAPAGPGGSCATPPPAARPGTGPTPTPPTAAPATAPAPPARSPRPTPPGTGRRPATRHQLLLGPAHQLRDPRRRRHPRLPAVQLGERLTDHQLQRLAQPQRRPLRLPHPRQALGLDDQPLEAAHVDLVVAQLQPVPAIHRGDRLGAQGVAQPAHTAVHHLAPRRRRRRPVQRLRQPIRRAHPARLHHQRPQHPPVTALQRGSPDDRHRTQHPHPHLGAHHREHPPPASPRQRPRLPRRYPHALNPTAVERSPATSNASAPTRGTRQRPRRRKDCGDDHTIPTVTHRTETQP